MTRARILVVDEERWTEAPLKRSLSMVGYQVRNDACESALAHLDVWRPHLVFIDRSTPNRAGIELCRRVRARTRIPIVVLAARDLEPEDRAQLNGHVNVVLERSRFSTTDILAELHRVIGARTVS